MKKIFTLLVIGLSLSSCGPSTCECVEAIEFAETWNYFKSNPDYSTEETRQCILDHCSPETLNTNSARKSALKNARKECN